MSDAPMFHVKRIHSWLARLDLRRRLAHRLRKLTFRVDGRIAIACGDGAFQLGIDRETLVACVEAAMPDIDAAINRQARVALGAKARLDSIAAKQGAKR